MQFNFRKNFEFLDKRDENELILKYSATKKASELCNFVIEKNLNANKSLRKLIDSHLDSKLVDLYFHKLLLAEFENCGLDALSNKLIIKDYDNKKNNNKLILKIFLSKNILKDINLFYGKKILKFNYFFAIPYLFKNFFVNLFKLLLFLSYLILKNFKKNQYYKNKNISFNYNIGLFEYSKSDIFWINKDIVSKKSINTFFFENRKLKSSFLKNKKQMLISKKLNLHLIHDFELNFINNIFKKIKIPILFNSEFSQIYYDISQHHEFKKLNYYFKFQIYILIQQISFWSNFFKKNNIMIHYDSNINGTNPVLKAIALNYLDRISFNNTRSYPREGLGMHNAWYPNDIIFLYGNDSMIKIKKTHNNHSNIIISGYPYPFRNKKIDAIQNIFSKKQYKILILDNLYSENSNSNEQFILKEKYENFYNSILSLHIKFDDLVFIIKPKRLDKLLKIKSIYDKILLLKQNDKLILIEDSEIDPIHLSFITDFIFSTGVYFSGALIEAININNKGVFYDYANTKSIEEYLYKWGENKTIFNNIDKMINEFVYYKNNPSSRLSFGNWTDKYYDYMKRSNGQLFIKSYISKLFENILLHEKKNSIKYTNDYFNIN